MVSEMAQEQWTFIGAGNMASSLIGGLVNSGVDGKHITVVDINAAAVDVIKKSFDVNSASSIKDISDGAMVVVAVKPHIVQTVCTELSAKKPALVISVAAGVRTDAMQSWLGSGTPVIRCMPNTPALLGLGATGLFASASSTDQQRSCAQNLLSTAGKSAWVEEESQLDAITALSGSGPAYFFYLIEHMANAAQDLGLSKELSVEFAIETAFGAASMAREQKQSPQVLRENVTSKGGTTAAALAAFDANHTSEIVAKAMRAALERAVELGDEFGADSSTK